MALVDVLKRVTNIGYKEKQYPILGFFATLRTLKADENLQVLKMASSQNNTDLKNREYSYSILSRSLRQVRVDKDVVEFESADKALEFLKECDGIIVEELEACYENLVSEQKKELETKFGELHQTLQAREMFKQQMALLTGTTLESEVKEEDKDKEQVPDKQAPEVKD